MYVASDRQAGYDLIYAFLRIGSERGPASLSLYERDRRALIIMRCVICRRGV